LCCDICGKARDQKGRLFSGPESLLRHKRAAHGRQSPPVAKRRGNGRVHLAARTTVKFCPQCGCNLEVVNAALTLAEGGLA
jgi:hypothetical protein